MERKGRYPAEVKERAVRLVFEQQPSHASQWATISSIAAKMGCTPETLRSWVRQAERDSGARPGLTTGERQRLKELERENRELRRLVRPLSAEEGAANRSSCLGDLNRPGFSGGSRA